MATKVKVRNRNAKKPVTRTARFQKFVRAGRKRVYDLMKDGAWHDRFEIQNAAGGEFPASEGLRRMRELRKFFTIESRVKDQTQHLFEYRFVRS